MLLSNSPWTRREFLRDLSIAGGAGLIGLRSETAAAEPPPESTTIRLLKTTTICFAPFYVVEALLRLEGFTDIQYVTATGGFSAAQMVANGELDFGSSFAGTVAYHLDQGYPVTAVGGLHVGCYELFAHEPIRSINDLKGQRLGVQTLSSSAHLYLSIMATHIGLDADRDIEWVTSPDGNAMELFIAGESDAFLAFPPEPQELRDHGFNRVILNTILDKPWSYYFCCMMYGNRDWVRTHPVATKRFLRAVYKAAAFCQVEPEQAARQLVDGGFAKNYDHALQAIQEIPYDLWHEYDSEDTLRFFALRLHEAGMIQTTPDVILAEGTDWRFVNELKRELKA